MIIKKILRVGGFHFIMNKILYIGRIILYTIIVFIFSLFSPWWIIAIVGTFIGFYSKTGYNAIIDSTISLSMAWLIMLINNLFIQDYIIINKIQDFLGLNSNICLHNSDPILPPAPVTKIFFPLIFLFNKFS